MRRDLLVLVVLIAVLGAVLRPQAPNPEAPKNPGCDVMVMAIGDLPEGLLERYAARAKNLRVAVGWRHLGLEMYIDDIRELDPDRVLPALADQARQFGARKIAVTTMPLKDDEIYVWNEQAALIRISGAPEDEAQAFRLLDMAIEDGSKR